MTDPEEPESKSSRPDELKPAADTPAMSELLRKVAEAQRSMPDTPGINDVLRKVAEAQRSVSAEATGSVFERLMKSTLSGAKHLLVINPHPRWGELPDPEELAWRDVGDAMRDAHGMSVDD